MPPSRAQRARTAERRTKAIALRIAGADWEQIAATLEYKGGRGEACKDVTRALEAHIREQHQQAEVLRETELLRLDRLQRGQWTQAVAGDSRAADTVLKIVDRRMRLLGLDVPPDVEERIRREMVVRIAAQMFTVFGQVLDGLGLSDEQRQLAPTLIEQAVGVFAAQERRQIEGSLIGDVVDSGEAA